MSNETRFDPHPLGERLAGDDDGSEAGLSRSTDDVPAGWTLASDASDKDGAPREVGIGPYLPAVGADPDGPPQSVVPEVNVQPTVPFADVRQGFRLVAVKPTSRDRAAAVHPGDNHSALANVRPSIVSGCRSSEEKDGHSCNQDKVSTPSQPHEKRFPLLTGNVKRAGTTSGRRRARVRAALASDGHGIGANSNAAESNVDRDETLVPPRRLAAPGHSAVGNGIDDLVTRS